MIASRQPEEVLQIVERYEKDLKQTEASYLDLIIKSGGLLTYDEIMGMPVDSLALFVDQLNSHRDDQAAEAKAARKPQGRR